MAILKEITNEKGIVARYHRIAGINQNFINPEPVFDVYVYGYASEQNRINEKAANDKDYQEIISAAFHRLPINDTAGYSRADIYARLKNEIPAFAGAEDV